MIALLAKAGHGHIADSLRYTDQVGAIAALLAVMLVLAIIDRIGR